MFLVFSAQPVRFFLTCALEEAVSNRDLLAIRIGVLDGAVPDLTGKTEHRVMRLVCRQISDRNAINADTAPHM